MKYLISFRDGDVDYDYASYDELEDARQAYERAIEELQDAQSVKLSDTTGDTIDSHFFWASDNGLNERAALRDSPVKSRALNLYLNFTRKCSKYIPLLKPITICHWRLT